MDRTLSHIQGHRQGPEKLKRTQFIRVWNLHRYRWNSYGKFIFVRVDGDNWPIYLQRSWRVRFHVRNKSCHIPKIARVDDSPHNMWQILRQHCVLRMCFCVSLLSKVTTGALNFELLKNNCCAIYTIKSICYILNYHIKIACKLICIYT